MIYFSMLATFLINTEQVSLVDTLAPVHSINILLFVQTMERSKESKVLRKSVILPATVEGLWAMSAEHSVAFYPHCY